MRRLAALILVALAITVAAAPSFNVPPPNGHVHLLWSYDTNEMSTNLTFWVYSTTNIAIPVEQWPMVTNVVGTNLMVALDITPGPNFFVVSASNFWGETSITSAIASTPAVPKPMNDSVKIEKAP